MYLRKEQQQVHDSFLNAAIEGFSLLRSATATEGKSKAMIIELGLTLQALGYLVYVLTPYKDKFYYAHGFIEEDRHLGLLDDRAIIIADEARYVHMNKIIEYCEDMKIPIVGYVKFYN